MTLNLTQHTATDDQVAAGVIDLSYEAYVAVCGLLNFTTPPTSRDIVRRAGDLAGLAMEASDGLPMGVMIGGAPYLMGPLAFALKQVGLVPVFAFSVRESSEVAMPDGSVKKTSTFRHGGFVDAISDDEYVFIENNDDYSDLDDDIDEID